ncbi:MAG: ATP-binding protein [Proteobacteria bacterium]|nr:ATP-binding protein [Pseudomonadota bacterium]
MVSQVSSVAYQGIEVIPVEVQVHMASGLPAFSVVGLADKAVAESRERVRAALSSLGMALPPQRITVNLAPADLQKEGSHFDLPIALGLLASLGVIPQAELSQYIVLGELSLDGRILPVPGVLPAAIAAEASRKGIICPAENGPEAAFASEQMALLAPNSLISLVNHFKGTQVLRRPTPYTLEESMGYPDLADVKGQETAKRALEIAAAGGHNMLMVGPPGSGKSMLASRLPGLLPPLTPKEMLEVSMVQSIAGQLVNGKLTRTRPFRDRHHSSSMAALIGGGMKAKPGEVTLAHEGVLFLDELPEFGRQVLDSLRQPLETQSVTVARAQMHATYPANFQLIAAMNPCRCGYLGDESRSCNKAPRCGTEYQSKLSGPLLDRFDLHIDVPAVSPLDIERSKPVRSAEVAARVRAARELQTARYTAYGVSMNGRADGEALEQTVMLDGAAKKLLMQAVEPMGLSMRGHNRVLRVARTIADLEHSIEVTHHHMAEALSYRHRVSLKKVA